MGAHNNTKLPVLSFSFSGVQSCQFTLERQCTRSLFDLSIAFCTMFLIQEMDMARILVQRCKYPGGLMESAWYISVSGKMQVRTQVRPK
jgi:hypothetical protein